MAIIVTRATTGLVSGTGTITTSTSSTTVTGVGTLFTTEVDYAGKALYTSADVYIGTVSAIASNTSLTLTANAAVAVSGGAYKIGYLPKNSPLSNTEIDTNFINLNNNKLELSDSTAVNIANSVVRRDGSGNFAAGTVTAALSGNASTATTLQTARNINGISFNGSANIFTPCTYDSAFKNFSNPAGGIYTTSTSSVTGAIAVTFPVGMTDSMITMTLKVFEYTTNETFEVHIGGYMYNVGNTWANNPTAYIIGNPGVDRRFTVRFGYTSGGKAIVYIGELASSWAYPQVYITEVTVGYSGFAESFASGWSIGFEASAFQNVTATISSTTIQVGYGVSTNTANTVVQRDGSGNFSAGTITANLTGSASALVTGNNYQVNSLGVGTAASGTAGEIRATNAITAYYSSDRRLKENIVPIDNALAKVQMLNGVFYDWTDEYIANHGGEDGYFVRKNDVGLIAQDVEQVLPQIVGVNSEGYKAIKYERVVALLVESIKELKAEIDELKARG